MFWSQAAFRLQDLSAGIDIANGLDPNRCVIHFAMYAAARTIPLAVVALIAICKRSESALLILGTLAGIIQLLDAGIGLLQHDFRKSVGSRYCRIPVLRGVSANYVCAKPHIIALFRQL